MQVITIKAHGQYLLQKNLETDFGAVGDGVNDNTDAFIKAGIFFSNFLDITGNGDTIGELIIPSFYPANSLTPAVYKVGRQLVFNDSFLVTEIFNGIEKRRKFRHTNIAQGAISGLGDTLENYGMFFLNNVHNLTIKGEVAASPPTIRYKDGLMFGSFLTPTSTFTAGNFTQTNNTNTIQPLLFYGINVDHTTKGWTAPFLFIKNCSDITISDLRLDGNNLNFVFGGVWSNNGGMQLSGDGINCQGSSNIDLANVHVNQFGRDGMTLEKACENITINDCQFNKNVRTGFGFICAEDVTVNNCQFNETGQITTLGFNSSLSNPGSGLDIEPDAGSSPQDKCENGFFKECRFYNNLGPALSTNFVIAAYVENMLFENDTFYSSRQTGIHCAGKKIVFKKCGIYASVATSSIANAEADATKYIDCDFADKPYNNIYWAHTNPLFNVPGYGEIQREMLWTSFKNCTFKVNDKGREFFWLNWTTGGMLASTWTVMETCTLTYNNEGTPALQPSYMRGVRFKGINKVQNTLNGLNSYHLINTRDIMIEGSNTACEPNKFTLDGQVEHLHFGNGDVNNPELVSIGYDINNVEGYAQYIANEKSLVGVNLGNRLKISSKSAMHFHNNASLYGAGKYECNGGLLMHKGSYLNLTQGGHFEDPTNVTVNNLIYIDNACNQTINIAPIWCNGIGFGTGATVQPTLNGTWQGTFENAVCAQGGHALIISPICSPFIYKNIISSGSMNLMYNTDITCFGGASANISFTVNGGVPNYTISCVDINGGSPLDFNTNYVVSTGVHTFMVVDAGPCTNYFEVPISTTLDYKIIKGCVGNTSAAFTVNACNSAVTGPATATYIGNYTWTANVAGTYTITATTAQNTTVTKTLYIGQCNNCISTPPVPDDAEWYAPNAHSSSISPNGILTPAHVVLQGAVVVDNEWFIYDKKLHMTSDGILSVAGNKALVLNHSDVRGCDNYWNGIVANTPESRVIINNYSMIQDMLWGVNIENNAFIHADSSTYKNNLYGIRIKNNMNPGLESFIINNTFIGDNMPGYMGMSKPISGVTVDYSGNIEIGKMGNRHFGNHFENMTNGIYINQTQPMAVNSTIGIYNNTFKNIQKSLWSDYHKVANCYLNMWGAAIYAQADANINTQSNINVGKEYNSRNNYDFENCDKAIVALGAGAVIQDQRLNNCLMGIMCNSIYNRNFNIQRNYINDAHIGVEVTGFMRSTRVVDDSINATKTVVNLQNIAVPIGIKLIPTGIMNNAENYAYIIASNHIAIDKITGVGIMCANGNKKLWVNDNAVRFTTSNTIEAAGYNINTLIGYWINNNTHSVYSNNRTIGPQNINVWRERNSMGMLMSQSQYCALECNSNYYTWWGIFGWGDNKTGKDKIRNNRCNANIFPWLLTDINSAPGASFGDVGDPNSGGEDNGNQFIATNGGVDWRSERAGVNAAEYKVFRWSNLQKNDKIYTKTTLLQDYQSGPFGSGYEYVGTPNANNINDICAGGIELPSYFTAYGIDSNEYNQSMSVVNDSVSYLQYAQVGSWIDRYKVYMALDQDSILLNSDPSLQTYYDTVQSSIIGDILNAERMLQTLYDSTTDSTNYAARYADAYNANEAISNGETWEMNEHFVNAVWLYLSHSPIDSVDSSTVNTIQSLAASCPFVEGLAVYKARTLWAVWEPNALFDDRVICAQGQNKNQDNSNIDEFILSNLKALTAISRNNNELANNVSYNELTKNVIIENLNIKLYPNPASTQITIAYKSTVDGYFVLYNSLGEIITKTSLSKDNTKTQFSIKEIADGLYYYEVNFREGEKVMGKLSIFR